jgi:hypothetical protein
MTTIVTLFDQERRELFQRKHPIEPSHVELADRGVRFTLSAWRASIGPSDSPFPRRSPHPKPPIHPFRAASLHRSARFSPSAPQASIEAPDSPLPRRGPQSKRPIYPFQPKTARP